jgi:hypothetical protein
LRSNDGVDKISGLLRELQGSEHKTAPGEDELDLPARKSGTNSGPRVFGDPALDKMQSRANGAAR